MFSNLFFQFIISRLLSYVVKGYVIQIFIKKNLLHFYTIKTDINIYIYIFQTHWFFQFFQNYFLPIAKKIGMETLSTKFSRKIKIVDFLASIFLSKSQKQGWSRRKTRNRKTDKSSPVDAGRVRPVSVLVSTPRGKGRPAGVVLYPTDPSVERAASPDKGYRRPRPAEHRWCSVIHRALFNERLWSAPW